MRLCDDCDDNVAAAIAITKHIEIIKVMKLSAFIKTIDTYTLKENLQIKKYYITIATDMPCFCVLCR